MEKTQKLISAGPGKKLFNSSDHRSLELMLWFFTATTILSMIEKLYPINFLPERVPQLVSYLSIACGFSATLSGIVLHRTKGISTRRLDKGKILISTPLYSDLLRYIGWVVLAMGLLSANGFITFLMGKEFGYFVIANIVLIPFVAFFKLIMGHSDKIIIDKECIELKLKYLQKNEKIFVNFGELEITHLKTVKYYESGNTSDNFSLTILYNAGFESKIFIIDQETLNVPLEIIIDVFDQMNYPVRPITKKIMSLNDNDREEIIDGHDS
jgi:hypothetical protein